MPQYLVMGRPVHARVRAGKKLAEERFEDLVLGHSAENDSNPNNSAVQHELRCTALQVMHNDSPLRLQLRHIARLVQASEPNGDGFKPRAD